MILVELAFPISGSTLPEDNGYTLFAAISRALGGHLPEGMTVSSIGGRPQGHWKLLVSRRARLRIRTPADRIAELLPLAGKFLDVGGLEIGLGVPEIRALEPASTLASRLVTIKGFTEPEPFLEAARRQMAASDISGRATIPIVPGGRRQGLPQRRVLRVKGRLIVGFAMTIEDLSEGDSLRLLAHGLGGRRHFGCGIFAPPRQTKGVKNGL